MDKTAIAEWFEARKLGVGVALLGLLVVGVGIFLWKTAGSGDSVEVVTEQKVQGDKTVEVVVDIAGAVKNPGVYHLNDGARVEEVVNKAGGFTSNADTKWIEVNLNRATKVTDGMKIFIPEIGEEVIKNDIKVNINSASVTDLDGLPGVGAVTADKIVAGRPYVKIEDLTERKIVTAKVFEGLKDKISVW
jgi:competence protein ComEA